MNLLPNDMVNKVAEYLPVKTLAQLDQVNTKLHKMVSDPQLPLLQHKKRLEEPVIQANIQNLWNHTEANLDVSSDGTLKVISNWNLFRRLWKWIRNFNGEVDQRVQEVCP